MCERPLEEKLVGQKFAGSERDAGLAVDAHHGFLDEGFSVDVSDFFNTRTAVFVASRVKQYQGPKDNKDDVRLIINYDFPLL